MNVENILFWIIYIWPSRPYLYSFASGSPPNVTLGALVPVPVVTVPSPLVTASPVPLKIITKLFRQRAKNIRFIAIEKKAIIDTKTFLGSQICGGCVLLQQARHTLHRCTEELCGRLWLDSDQLADPPGDCHHLSRWHLSRGIVIFLWLGCT